MKNIATIVLMLIGINLFGQSDSIDLIDNMLNDIRNNQLSNPDIIEKYITYNSDLSISEKKEGEYPILTPKLDFMREQLNEGCSELKILKHDENSAIINAYKLKCDSFDHVYYVICDSLIIAPVLINGNKVMSITVYSKSEAGTKRFVRFD